MSTDGLNRLVSKTTGPTVTGYGHDRRGDRLNDDTRTYAYDSETKGLGSPSAPWHHDPLGRLSGASTSASAPPAIVYESYLDNLIAERTPGSSTVARRHVFGPGTDEPLVWYEGSSRRFLHADERGSIVAVTSDAGALLAINRYDEYGRTETTSAAHMGRFLYTGQRWFGAFGLYHYKNRVYDPRTGRFMQPDPIGYDDGMNLYAYVGADPVNLADPLGLAKVEMCTGTRICRVHDSGGSGGSSNGSNGSGRTVSGSVQVFGDINGFSSSSRGGPSSSATAGTEAAPGSDDRPSAPGWWRQNWIDGIPQGWVLMGDAGGLGLSQGSSGSSREPERRARPRRPNHCSNSPDNIGGIEISGACATHDWCYGSSIHRSVCDDNLYADILYQCRHQGGDRGICYIMAGTYWSAVRRFGRSRYVGSGVND